MEYLASQLCRAVGFEKSTSDCSSRYSIEGVDVDSMWAREKTVSLYLKDVPTIPVGMRESPDRNVPARNIAVDLVRLYHHYYFDGYGVRPPNPDPLQSEYLQLLSKNCRDFRFVKFVDRANETRKRGISTELGQAFCRWVLSTHFGMVYFAHMNEVLDKVTHPAFEGMSIRRCAGGDAPDYLCARKVTEPCIAEAKGRFRGIAFENKEFKQWQKQFDRICVRDRYSRTIRLKGFIVGTRFVSESNSRNTSCALYVEDPIVKGELEYNSDEHGGLGRGAAAVHYGRVLSKLNIPIVAAALSFGFVLQESVRPRVMEWECLVPPFYGKRFIGGYIAHPPYQYDSRYVGSGRARFVGLERWTAQFVVDAARGEWQLLDKLELLKAEQWPFELSWLEDGTVIGPSDFFRPAGLIEL